jgi:hypothetical protein
MSLAERDKDTELTPLRRGMNCGILSKRCGPSAQPDGHISPIRHVQKGAL